MKIAVLYLPVIHAGHLDFCKKQRPDILYVLGSSLISEFPLLKRDLRALSPEYIQAEAQAISLAPKVLLLERDNLEDLKEASEIIISDDEVGRKLKELYFPDKKVTVDSTFVRWNGIKSISKNPPIFDKTILARDIDKKFMLQAYDESKKASDWWRQVGVVIAKNDKVILTGFNRQEPSENSLYIDGDPRANFDAGVNINISTALHGEAKVISEAAKIGISLEGASIYITTFPCPNCAMMIVSSGIKKVYYVDGYSLLNALDVLKLAEVEIIRVDKEKLK